MVNNNNIPSRKKIILILSFLIILSFSDFGSSIIPKKSSSEISEKWRVELEDTRFEKIVVSDNGRYVLGAGRNNGSSNSVGRMVFFDTLETTPEFTFNTSEYIKDLAMSSDGRFFGIAGGDDNCTYFFNRTESTPLWFYDTNNITSHIDMDSKGNYIVVGNYNGSVYLFTNESATPLWVYHKDSSVSDLAISDNGNYICVSFYDNTMAFFSHNNSIPLWINISQNLIEDISISQDGSKISTQENGNLRIFSKDSPQPIGFFNCNEDIEHVKIISNGEEILYDYSSSESTDQINLIDSQTTQNLWSSQENYQGIKQFSADSIGNSFIAAKDSELVYYTKDSIEPVWSIGIEDMGKGPSFFFSDAEFVFDGSKFVSSGIFENKNSMISLFSVSQSDDTDEESSDDKKDDATGPTVSLTLIPILAAALGIAYLILTKKSKLKA